MRVLARFSALAVLTAALASVAAHATEVNFITDFGYNGRHSYFYVALDKGYYKSEGLDVTIDPETPTTAAAGARPPSSSPTDHQPRRLLHIRRV